MPAENEATLVPGPEGFLAETPPHGAGPGQSGVALTAAMVLGIVAYMILGIQPVLLGGLVETGRLGVAALGKVATAETLALALAAGVFPYWLQRGGARWKVAAGALLLLLADIASCRADGGLALGAARLVAGGAEGLVLAGAILVITYTKNPDRVSGWFLAVTTAPQIIVAYALGGGLLARFGTNGGFLVLAALAVVGVVASLGLPRAAQAHAAPAGANDAWRSPAALLALAAITLQNAAIGAAWNYAEQMAHQAGLTAAVVGIAIAATLVFQIAGAGLSAAFGHFLPYVIALTLACLLQVGDALLLGSVPSAGLFTLGCCAFGVYWLAMVPFQIRLLLAVDATRRTALLISPASLIGLAVGPFFGSILVGPHNVAPVFHFAAMTASVSLALYLLAQSRIRAVAVTAV